MGTTIIPDYPRGITFEQVWAALMETDRIVKETAERQKETDRIVKETAERQKETTLQMKETDRQIKETDRQIKDYNKRFGDFYNRFGEVIEYMIAPNLREKFKEFGLDFPKANQNSNVSDHKNNIFLEIDVLLENGDFAMLVEIKTKLTTEHIKEHVKCLEKMRSYADLRGDKRKFMGSVAGVVITANARNYALKQGFFVIEPSGEDFNITPPEGNPGEW